MITENPAQGEVSAQCRGCSATESGRRVDGITNADKLWWRLLDAGWWRTNYEIRIWGDTYWLWCPTCWKRIQDHPGYDWRTNVLTFNSTHMEHR